MKEDEHDNEPTRWTSIGWQALLIANKLRCAAQLRELASEDQKEERKENPEAGDKEERRPEQDRKYVEARLRQIAAWERKIRNGKM
jgi:uncharacterized protein YcbK (DUF882 family)